MTATLEHTDVMTNGVRLHVVQAGPVDGELVILLHGFPEFWYSWRKQIPALASAGYRVYAPDQRGYNLSDKPRGLAAYDLNLLAADVVGLIDAAGREQCYLVGHDWGAAVAWWVAMHSPQRLKKLAILNVPHPSIMLKTLASSPAQMLKSWYIGMFQMPWLPEQLMLANNAALADVMFKRTANAGSFSDADIAEYRKAWQQPGATTAMINWYRALVQHRPERTASTRITVPTQILWGVNDVALTREMASGSLKYCENAQLTWFEDATHWLQHDKPDAVNARLIEFLTG